MNFIKGIVAKRKGGIRDEGSLAAQKERSLCIQHLRKLFLEFLHPSAPLTPEQQELKQYFMLPLFLKAFKDTNPNLMSERFGDVLQFAGHTSKLMVTEVQRRAANKSNIQASKDILAFFCHHQDDMDNKGWNLINTLYVLTGCEPDVIECMIAAALQSILVKCIKLFFSLPSNFGNHDKCSQVQKVLISILVRLCNHSITAKELIRTDDLASLFEALTLSIKPEHMIWRSGVSEILTSITRHCFTKEVINYIHEKSCISLSLANIENICDKDPLAVVEMFVTLTCVLKDSAEVSPVLFDSFCSCQGYKFLTRILINFSGKNDGPSQEACRNLVLLIASLVMTGYKQLLPSVAISTPFQKTEYIIPKPNGTQGVSIRNLDAFKVLMGVFLESSNQMLCLHILNSIQSIFNYDNANYFIIEPLHPLAQFIQRIPEKGPLVKSAILKLIEFVALHLLWVPSQELVAMTILFKDPNLKSSQCAVLNTLILLINHHAKYKNVLRDAGLVDVMVVALKRYSVALKDSCQVVEGKELSPPSSPMDESTTDYLFLLMECLRLLIENNQANAELFRQYGGSRCVHNLIPFMSERPYALRIVQQLIVDGGHDDLGTLLGLMHSTSIRDIKLKLDVLSSLLHIFEMNPQTRSVFQEVGGFVYVVSVLVSLEGSLATPPVVMWENTSRDLILELTWMTFNVLTSAMKDEPVNKIIFMDEIRFKGLIDTVKLLGCFPSSRQTIPAQEAKSVRPKLTRLNSILNIAIPKVERNGQKYVQMVLCKTILSMATGCFDTWEINLDELNISLSAHKIPRIFHPTALNGLVEVLPLLCQDKESMEESNQLQNVSDVLLYVVCQVQHLIGSEINQQLMCDAGLPLLLLQKCEEVFIDESHPLNAPLTKLFERLASQSLHPKVLRTFLRLGSPLCSKSPYAILRGPEKENVKSLDVTNTVDKVELMSLRIVDGDIQLSPSKRNNTPFLLEENEFQSIESEESGAFSNRNSQQFMHRISIGGDELRKSEECLKTDDLIEFVAPTPEEKLTDPVEVESEEKSPGKDTGEENGGQDEEDQNCNSNYSPVDRIESLLEEDFNVTLPELENNFVQEISRLCDRFEGRPLPQNLVKSVVSLTTPRDVLSTTPLEAPAFIEFNMNEDGFACLFVPALTPHLVHSNSLQSFRMTNNSSVNLSLSSSSSQTERTFPPPTGLSYSGWIYLESIPNSPSGHSFVGLFTVEKQWEELCNKRVINNGIFQIHLDLHEKTLIINTEDQHSNTKGNIILRVKCDELFETNKWNHLCVILHRNVMRTSTASVYVNGSFVENSKIKYIQQGTPTGADINTCKLLAYIGTHPKQCHISDLVWRLGPMAIFEEPLVEESINSIYALGPGYIGCFQSSCLGDIYEEDGGEQKISPLIAEEKILLSVNPHNVTLTTLLKLSAQCSTSDLILIATEMNISSEDKHTPIQLLANSSLHLNGANRPIGLFFIGSTGIRIFCPNPVASSFVSIGGMSILLCLIAMVTQLGELYASLKALTCILQSSRIARREMSRVHGYQILSFLLKKKKQLLNTHILHLVFSLVGTVRSDRESATIPNVPAFNDVLCNLEIWHNTPAELERSLFSHIYELITQGPDQQRNIQCLRKLGCVSKLIHVIQDGDITDATLNTVASVLSVLLCRSSQTSDLLIIGQYLASTLSKTSEHEICLDAEHDDEEKELQKVINQRNTLLDVLIHLLITTGDDTQFCEQLYNKLGFDWVLLFLGSNLHKTTALRGIRILFKMLTDPVALNHFQNGSANGYWLDGSEAITSKKTSVAAGFNVTEKKSEVSHTEYEVNHQSYKQKGMPWLTALLEEHTDLNEIYFQLFSLLLKGNISGGEAAFHLNIQTLHLIFWPPASLEKIKQEKLVQIYCLDSMLILLHLVRKLMSQPLKLADSNSKEDDIPSTIIQFLEFLYQNLSEVEAYCCMPGFLVALIATLFPLEEDKELMDFNVEVVDNEVDGGLPEDFETLSNHPCKDLVINFLKKIFIDILLQSSGKISSFTDMFLQSSPPTASSNQQQKFQTELLTAVIDKYTTTSIWKGISSTNSNFARFLMNGVIFAGKVVDRLWLGYFTNSYKIILQLIIHLIQNLEGSNMNPDLIYHSLNRVLLFQFSRPASRLTDQTNLLELLHKITNNSKIFFSAQNRDPEFISCLTHWLLVVGFQQNARRCTFQAVSYGDGGSSSSSDLEDGNSEDQELFQLITAATERVWNLFYTFKKESLEDIFGIQSTFISYDPMPVPSAGRTAGLDLNSARPLLGEHAAKSWINFFNNEARKKNEYLATPLKLPAKKMSKLGKISLKREKVAEEIFTVHESVDWLTVHLRAVQALVKLRFAKHSQEIVLRNQLAEKNWSEMELDLIREPGIWGPDKSNPLEKWMLVEVEGPCRMRKRLTRNDMFYSHYPYVEQEKEQLIMKHRVASSRDSKVLYQLCQKYTHSDSINGNILSSKENPFSWEPKLYSVDGFEPEDSIEEVNTQTIIQLLETGEKIYSMYRCARVRGLDSAEGLFLFGKNHFYVIDGFTLMSADSKGGSSSSAKEIKDIASLPEGSHEPLIPEAKGNSILKRSFSKWSFDEIKEAHKRRYLLQDIAIEVFSNDGSNHLLVFPKQSARNKVYGRITRVSPVLANSQESIAGMNIETDVETGQSFFGALMTGERSVVQRWVRGEITNFQYLTFLNTLAGRSYNDLMQYPIFPWILADYTSEFLDLTNPASFRDLSKPMGAQDPERLARYRKRYQEWEDPIGKTPAYYYGTHYSSAMIVASYLIRLEPFTQHFLRLQGGHFDLPDRLFHSVKDAWLSSSESNMADIKELIPEFFYLPDFLVNSNNFDLGTKQCGDELNDVLLPPWAKRDTIEFIRVHREALECDYVSSHLHEWIDLVFGYKQQGPAALEADNVFHHLFYEKSVDLESITDQLERKATIGFINNFGQMPKQLFKRAHPVKRSVKQQELLTQTGILPVYNPPLSDKLFFHHLNSLVPSVQPVKELKNAVGQISAAEKTLAATEANKALFTTTHNRIGWGYGDFSLRYFSPDEKLLAVFEDGFTGQTLCAACLNSKRFVTGGTSTAVCVWDIEQNLKDRNYSLSLFKVLYGHREDVLSIAVSKSYNIIVSGSEDKTCIIWDLRKLSYTRKLSIPSGGAVTCIAINHTTGDIVTCAGTHMYVWTVNGQLLVQENTSPAISGQILCCVFSEYNEWDEANVIVTGSTDGFVKMWGIEFYDTANLETDVFVEPIRLTSRSARSSSNISLENNDTSESLESKQEYLLVKYPSFSKRDWRRKLVLRHKLTMHTAFSRADNTEPASVTSLAISRDHRKVFVGDSRGRIYSWSMSDSVGRIADHWIKDEVADFCSNCAIKFTFSERRHHCRNCGNVFCGRCSRFESPVVHLRIFKAVRVCVNCYNELKRKPSLTFKER